MININDAEEALKGFLCAEDAYYDIEFESSTQMPNGSTRIEFSMQQAPRDLDEFMIFEDEENAEIDHYDLCSLDQEVSNEIYNIQVKNLGAETLEKMQIEADEPMAAFMFGTTSAGHHCDDEHDAYLTGTLLITPHGPAAESAAEEARQHMIHEINANSSTLIDSASRQLKRLSKYQGKASETLRKDVIELNRLAVR